MFIGHYAVALGTKKVSPKISLGTLFLASQFIDLLWPILLILGAEHARIAPGNTAFTPLDFYDYPISHSLLAVIGWSLLFGGIYFIIRRNLKNAFITGLCVLSHWLLDFISHRPDLPLMPGSQTFVGLGLWNSVAASLVVEVALFVMGLMLYLRTTAAKDKTGSYAFWIFVGFLMIIYIMNIVSPPPPDIIAVAYAGLALWLFVPWLYWIDRHRTVRE